MTFPLTPEQAEFQRLYPPHVYFAMTPTDQANAWAMFSQAKAAQLQQAAARQSVVTTLLVIFVVIPLISGAVWAIVLAVTGGLVQ